MRSKNDCCLTCPSPSIPSALLYRYVVSKSLGLFHTPPFSRQGNSSEEGPVLMMRSGWRPTPSSERQVCLPLPGVSNITTVHKGEVAWALCRSVTYRAFLWYANEHGRLISRAPLDQFKLWSSRLWDPVKSGMCWSSFEVSHCPSLENKIATLKLVAISYSVTSVATCPH